MSMRISIIKEKERSDSDMEHSIDHKAERILSIYSQLKQGELVFKEAESARYGVSQRTIQRDIVDIQCFLQNQSNETGIVQEIIFEKKSGGYRLETRYSEQLKPNELLAVCKVLLESRSLVKEELFPIIYKLTESCSGEEEKVLLKNFLRNEMHHYTELQHHTKLLDRIWLLEKAVKEQQYIEIRYKKLKEGKEVTRKVKPVGVMFSEFYYYLTAYIDGIDKKQEFQNPDDDFPTIYRIDRLQAINVLDEHFAVPYADRFEEGEFRKRIQFMYGGRLRNIKLKCTEQSLEAVLDKFPTAKVVKQEAGEYVVQAEVFGDGVDMWLRGQGETELYHGRLIKKKKEKCTR